MSTAIRLEHTDGVASLVLHSEKGLNIISCALLVELDRLWTEVESLGARVCIIRGEGKAFLAGANIKEMAEMGGAAAREFAKRGQDLFMRIAKSPTVSIAAIHGACLGGGCELALACDIRIGSSDIVIGQPEVNIGLIPGFGGTQRLPRVVGLGWALRMILSGEPLREQQAIQIGLITDSGEPADLASRAEKLARTIASRGPSAVKLAKHLTRESLFCLQQDGMHAEKEAFGVTFGTGEAKKGLTAFIEKRPPSF